MNQKGFNLLLIGLIVSVIIISLAVGYVFYFKKSTAAINSSKVPNQEPSVMIPSPTSTLQPLASSQSSASSDVLTLDGVKQLADKVTWGEASSSGTLEFYDYGKLNGQSLEGTYEIQSNKSPYESEVSALRDEKNWLSKGWQDDINQAADGVTGSAWGYYRDQGGKRQIINFHYEMDRADAERMFQARENLTEFNCPCKFNIDVFLSDWFNLSK